METVKFSMLNFLEVVLLGKEWRSYINLDYIHQIDNFEDFVSYPWGRVCFKATLEGIKSDCNWNE